MSAGTTPAPAGVRLHIQRLVVTGFDVRDQAGLRGAVQEELARLLAESHGFQPPSARHVQAEPFRAQPHASAPDLGRQIAAAVHGGITR